MSSATKKHRAIVIEDETVFRQLLSMALSRLPRMEVMGEYADGAAGLEACLRDRPDLVVVYLVLPGVFGLDVARVFRRQLPETRILVLTSQQNESIPVQLATLGVHGFVSKGEPLKVVIEAVEKVLAGGMFFSTSKAERAALSPLPAPALPALRNPLTPREVEVAVGVASGLSSKEIAAKLDLSVRTVEKHRANIMDKVEVREVASLVRWCVQQRLITI